MLSDLMYYVSSALQLNCVTPRNKAKIQNKKHCWKRSISHHIQFPLLQQCFISWFRDMKQILVYINQVSNGLFFFSFFYSIILTLIITYIDVSHAFGKLYYTAFSSIEPEIHAHQRIVALHCSLVCPRITRNL